MSDLLLGDSGGKSFIPSMRMRVKDYFTSTLSNSGSQLKLPSMLLSNRKDGSGDSGLESLSVNRQMGVTAQNSATLVFANKVGKLYRSPGKPTLDEETLTPNLVNGPASPDLAPLRKTSISRDPLVVEYLQDVIRQGLMKSDIALERQDLIAKIKSQSKDLGWPSWTSAPVSSGLADAIARLMQVNLIFDLMAPVEIDMQDAKGRWFGAFTGMITAIEDSYSVGEVPSISITCMDKMSVFGRSLATIQATLAPESLYATDAEKVNNASNINKSTAYLADNLSNKKIWEVFYQLAQVANATFTAQGYYAALLNAEQIDPAFKDTVGKFTSEEYGPTLPSFIRTASRDQNKNLLVLMGINNTTVAAKKRSLKEQTRFWNFLSSVRTSGKGGRDDHARLWKLWTFPNRYPDKTAIKKTLEFTLNPDLLIPAPSNFVQTGAPPSPSLAVFNVLNPSLGSIDPVNRPVVVPHADSPTKIGKTIDYLSYCDYRGLSNYWPFSKANGAILGSADELKRFPGANQPGVTGDMAIPFRDTGIAMFDNIFKPFAEAGTETILKFATNSLRSNYNNFMNVSAPAADKLSAIEQATFANIYTTGLGDLIMALPRWNQAPLTDADSCVAGPDSMLASHGYTADEKKFLSTDFFHGREYIMSDFGLVQRRISHSDEGKWDRVLAQGTFDWIGNPVPGDAGRLIDMGGSLGSPKFQGFYGDRTFQASQAFPIKSEQGVVVKDVLEHFASSIKIIQNLRPSVLDITYKIPRPIELGKNVFLPDDCNLYYITNINRNWTVGQDYTETYHGEYGHPVWFPMPAPWITLVNTDEASLKKTAKSITPNNSKTGTVSPLASGAPGTLPSPVANSSPSAQGPNFKGFGTTEFPLLP